LIEVKYFIMHLYAQHCLDQYTGWPKQVSHLPNYQNSVLNHTNETRFIRQIKVSIEQ